MDTMKVVLGVVVVTGSIILLTYRTDNHAILGKLITFGLLGLLVGGYFFIRGLLDGAYTQGDAPVQ